MAKYRSTDGVRWAFMKRFDVPWLHDPSVTYLTRWRIVQTPWFGIYLHRIRTPDSDRWMHNHPFDFISIVLRGGYAEVVAGDAPNAVFGEQEVRVHDKWSVHRMDRMHFHEIKTVHPNTWTLVLVGPRVQDWGFATDEGFVPHAEYFEQLKVQPQ
jgi:hypothetical protein